MDYFPITRIVVVGGGTSGWMAASFLYSLFNSPAGHPVSITLVESPDIGTIGVGEATVPTIRETLRIIGIGENAFLKATNATFKNAIKFANWRLAPQDDPREHFYHPFEPPTNFENLSAAPLWSEFLRQGGKLPFAYFASAQPWLCERGLGPHTATSRQYAAPLPYAYHTDAQLFGHMMRDLAMSRGVEQVLGTINHVAQDETGRITAVHTAEGREIAGDFFIDCTGFRGLLINKTLQEPFISYGNELLCDRAVTMRVPYADENTPIKPYTTSTAQDAGWIWDIGLYNRNGFGYVYSGNHASDEDAERTLRAYTGDLAGKNPVNRLRMRVGRARNFWVGNCLALGLSGGFIEPLESTGIYLVELGLKAFYDNLVVRGYTRKHIDHYNSLMSGNYDELRDFVQLHYVLTQRTDTEFWKANASNPHLSDNLRMRIDLCSFKGTSNYEHHKTHSLFGSANWYYILTGMGRRPEFPEHLPPLRENGHLRNLMGQLKKRRDNALAAQLPHLTHLKSIHDGTPPAA